MAGQTIFGPYRVKNIGAVGDVYEVVEMVDNFSNTWMELRPRKTYLVRQSAYALCARLNKRWQREHELDSEMLDYWRNAEN